MACIEGPLFTQSPKWGAAAAKVRFPPIPDVQIQCQMAGERTLPSFEFHVSLTRHSFAGAAFCCHGAAHVANTVIHGRGFCRNRNHTFVAARCRLAIDVLRPLSGSCTRQRRAGLLKLCRRLFICESRYRIPARMMGMACRTARVSLVARTRCSFVL